MVKEETYGTLVCVCLLYKRVTADAELTSSEMRDKRSKFPNFIIVLLLNLLIKLNNINFNKDNNVGALSISKQDIIKKYNKLSKEFYEASIIRGVSL